MRVQEKSGPDLERLWQRFENVHRNIIHYFIYALPPVSIDILSALSGISEVTVLGVMEELRRLKIVYRKKEGTISTYAINDIRFSDFVKEHIPEDETKNIFEKVIGFYSKSIDDGSEKILFIADLYRKLGNAEAGLAHIKNAADILYRTGDKEGAMVYYSLILENIKNEPWMTENIEIFLVAILMNWEIRIARASIHEHIAFLLMAERAAKRHKKWDFLARITLGLVSALLVAGRVRDAFLYSKNLQKLAEKIGTPYMHRSASVAMSESLFYKGEIAEAIRCYEKATGDLEEFGNDYATLKTEAFIGWCYVLAGRIARGIGMIDAVRMKARMLNLQNNVFLANFLMVQALLALRKITEAEALLVKHLLPPATCQPQDHFMRWSSLSCKAYILCTKGDYEAAFKCMETALEHLRFIEWIPMSHMWNLEYLDIIESHGFSHKECRYDLEIQRHLNGSDIYLKGSAFRYRASRNMDQQPSQSKILSDLKKSEKLLKRAGTGIDLARTRFALGTYYLKKHDDERAQLYFEMAWRFFSTTEKSLFPTDLMAIMPEEEKAAFLTNRIVELAESLGSILDTSSFLDRALNVAMDATMAMRGAYFDLESGAPKIIVSRNMDSSFFNTKAFKAIHKVIMGTAGKGVETIVSGSKGKNNSFNMLLQKVGIHSLICMPVKLRGHTYGYLCLDNRLDDTPFSENNLPFVRILCSQMALGLSNISMYNEMEVLKNRFEGEAVFYRQEMGVSGKPMESIIGQSKEIAQVLDQIRHVAPTDSSVLILGETGVGKELVAKAIHNLSTRKDGPFIPVNIAVLPHDLISSELFGHEKGAFTGADVKNKGRFELADGGTIFLDEIGELPPQIQVKLLRVLQEGSFERLGSANPIKSNFRVIAATNKDLRADVEKGRFRQDLYFRLNGFPVHIPPLRERKADIPLLTRFFVDKYSEKLGKKVSLIPHNELKKLVAYPWPGNVRELEHFIERALILSHEHKISFPGLDLSSEQYMHDEKISMVSLADMEREHIQKVLNFSGWKVSGKGGAALILGLKPSTLYFRMNKLGIKRPSATTVLT